MSLFESLNNPQAGGNQQQITLQSLKSNPEQALKQAGYNIPVGMHDAQQIINHLLQSGQVTNPRLQMAQQMLSKMRR